jgi:hypothetical protein
MKFWEDDLFVIFLRILNDEKEDRLFPIFRLGSQNEQHIQEDKKE